MVTAVVFEFVPRPIRNWVVQFEQASFSDKQSPCHCLVLAFADTRRSKPKAEVDES